jgi:hypothetical protein
MARRLLKSRDDTPIKLLTPKMAKARRMIINEPIAFFDFLILPKIAYFTSLHGRTILILPVDLVIARGGDASQMLKGRLN